MARDDREGLEKYSLAKGIDKAGDGMPLTSVTFIIRGVFLIFFVSMELGVVSEVGVVLGGGVMAEDDDVALRIRSTSSNSTFIFEPFIFFLFINRVDFFFLSFLFRSRVAVRISISCCSKFSSFGGAYKDSSVGRGAALTCSGSELPILLFNPTTRFDETNAALLTIEFP